MAFTQEASRLALSLAFLVTLANCHTFMYNPVPFPSQYNDNRPVASDGSDWPCKGEKDYDTYGITNIWKKGSTQQLQAMGGASHGGGSCQISITYDTKPTRESVWRVIHSIQGGCPIRNLLDSNYGASHDVVLPDVYNFTIPQSLPIGPAVMAWTWHGRWSVPEMFMNCAPVLIQGTTSPPNDVTPPWENSTLPLMFEANNGNGCWTRNKGSCLHYPNPGESVETNDCPYYPDEMLSGTCGDEYNLSGTKAPLISRVHFLFYMILITSALFLAYVALKKMVRQKYKRVSKEDF